MLSPTSYFYLIYLKSAYLQSIFVPAYDWAALISVHGISTIGHLIIDTEGLDCRLLQSFPFSKIRPLMVSFEHCHCDGPQSSRYEDRPVFNATIAILRAYGYERLEPYEGGPFGLIVSDLNIHYALSSTSSRISTY